VTGAGRGIGRAIALSLAEAGARVVAASRSRMELEEVCSEIRRGGGQAWSRVADVSVAGDCALLVSGCAEDLGGAPDILINAAGIAPSAPLAKTTDQEWHAAIETNLSGPFYTMRAALPAMTASGWGRVVNVASIAGKVGFAYVAAYAASKHGLLGLTKCAALEAADKGVTVNAICPGYVDSPMTDVSVARIAAKTGLETAEIRRRLEQTSPQKRLYTPREVAALALFLCGDGASGINGQALNIDGGTVA
jgi:NAD(P)-dependent dehydrogenase (short-subunit alcohol dehydrogenase family)